MATPNKDKGVTGQLDRNMNPQVERRFTVLQTASVEVREDAEPKIAGTAAVFYDGTPATEYELWADVKERIMPDAFAGALDRPDDVRALFNHDSSAVLGRTPDTLTLSTTKIGLRYEVLPPDTATARDVMEYLRRGDVSGSSFQFKVTDEVWRVEDKVEIREVLGVELFDVGPVTFPAYDATSAGLRADLSVEEARAAHTAWKAKLTKPYQWSLDHWRRWLELQEHI